MNRHRGILRELQKRECNKECADCRSKGPLWASANLGVFLCIRCAGIHRKLGTHISFVRSVNLDSWKDKHINVMRRVGNKVAKEYYEYNKPAHIKKPSEHSSPETVEQYIRAKYERKVWARRPEDEKDEEEDEESESEEEVEVEVSKVENERASGRSRKAETDSPLLNFEDSQGKLTPNTFVQQLFTKVDESRNKPQRVQSSNSTDFLSNLMGVEKSKPLTGKTPTPGNGNGDSILHFNSNSMTETKKDRIMKMFEGPKQPQYPTQVQPKTKKPDPNEPSFMKFFDQPAAPQRTMYPSQGYYANYGRNNNHVRYSPQAQRNFTYVPKGRSVPLNYRGNSTYTNYSHQRNKNTKQSKSGADSFF